jgi:hypothetical protein
LIEPRSLARPYNGIKHARRYARASTSIVKIARSGVAAREFFRKRR